MSILYHDGNRRLQDEFDSRRIADRLEEKLTRTAFTDDDKAFIESATYFFLATADAEGRPDCSFKGGMPGFVRITGPSELAFPDYDGNGMFKSLGNLCVNANVGMLFIDLHEKPRRLRVNGTATVSREDPLLAAHRRRAAHGARDRARDLPQLPALHPDHADGRAFDLHAAAGRRAAGAGMEGLRRFQGLHPPAPADVQGQGRVASPRALSCAGLTRASILSRAWLLRRWIAGSSPAMTKWTFIFSRSAISLNLGIMPPFAPDSATVTRVVPSPNHGERRIARPDMLLLHYTGMPDAQAALERLCAPDSEVSAHYVVFEDGTIVQCVPEARRAWHAGASSWGGATDINSHSIGIEIANPGHDYGYPDFPDAQIAAVIALCRDIVARHHIAPERVLAHSGRRARPQAGPGREVSLGRVCTQRASAIGSRRRRSKAGRCSRSATAGRACARCSRILPTTATASPRPATTTKQPRSSSSPSSATSAPNAWTASPMCRRRRHSPRSNKNFPLCEWRHKISRTGSK